MTHAESDRSLPEPNPVEARFSQAYDELRRLAGALTRDDAATLNPTALVHEAWLKLAASPDLAPRSGLHFKRLAARAMRQVLVEAARRRNAEKRGGGKWISVTLSAAEGSAVETAADMLALDAALETLARMEPRQARMVELRFFGGLDVAETALALEVSEATVLRDWRAAKAWLSREIQRAL